ncbi:MAG TPA: complex I NDUFA9 subunit family protein [Alphaproteobacteria bacterium]|nr:complex I NDUFA9 subunit family protein [Alphaproteobacteria bacterium]
MIQPKQITVFGGTGFLGRHIIRRLARTGAVIRVPTRDPEKGLILKPMGDVGQIVPFHSSIHRDADVAMAVKGSDIVINLLGTLCEKGRGTFQAVHVEATARIARLSKEHNVSRLIHMSAIGANVNSGSAYARSKAAAEQAMRIFFGDATTLRPSIVFGPEDKFFNRFASYAKLLPFLPLIGGGTNKFQPIYVGDVADAVMAALEKSETRGQMYELGGAEIYSFRELMELMLKVIGRKRLFLNVPYGWASFKASLLELLPEPPLTRDQVELLKGDNVVHENVKTMAALGITPTSLEVILPTYLNRFRKVRHLSPVPSRVA